MMPPAPAARIQSVRLRFSALALVLCSVLALWPVAGSSAQSTRVVGPLTFEGKEWLGLTVDGLRVDSFDGSSVPRVTFGFASNEPNSGSDGGAAIRLGPADAAHVQGQGLEGPSKSVLTLEFDEPIVGIQGGMAFLGKSAEEAAARLQATNEVGVTVLSRDIPSSVASATLFPGALIEAEFDEPVTRVRLEILSTARRFFLDNLVFVFGDSGFPPVGPPPGISFDGSALRAQMIGLPDSRAVAMWHEAGLIRFQTLSELGLPEDHTRVVTAPGQYGWAPTLTPHGDGFAVAWYGREELSLGPPEGVYLRLYLADGTPASPRIRLFSPQTRRPTRIALTIASVAGDLVVTWDDGQKVGAVRFDPSDETSQQVSLSMDESDCGLHALSIGDRTAVLWCDGELWLQYVGPQNAPLAEPVALTEGLAGSPISIHAANPPRLGGRAVRAIAWTQHEDDENRALYARTLDREGPLSPAVRVSSHLAEGSTPAIAGHEDGSFLTAWLGPQRADGRALPRRLYAQIFYATGVAASEPLEPMSESAIDPESVAVVWDGRSATLLWENSVASATRPGSYLTNVSAERDRSPCRASATSLCLQDNRFRVSVQYRDFDGLAGRGRPVGLTSDTGYFWFFDQGAADLVVKVLDGRTSNGHHWVFFGSLTNVAFDLMVEDRATGQTATYSNELGSFASAGDTRAFEAVGARGIDIASNLSPSASAWSKGPTLEAANDVGEGGADGDRCQAALLDRPLAACLSDRFLIEIAWQDFTGKTGDGHGQAISEDTASFWFFDAANLEMVVKVLDGRVINDHFWVFFGSLSNVAFDLTVTDLESGLARTWSNPAQVFASRGDTTALPAGL